MSALEIKRDEKKGNIWSHVRRKWLVETPEETVRQEYFLVLVNEYGFALDQIAKVLFIKAYVERSLLTRRNKTNLFTVDVLKLFFRGFATNED